MNENVKTNKKEIDVNLGPVFLALLKKAWLIGLVALIAAAGSYLVTKIFVRPTYRVGFTAYVNNQTQAVRDSLSSSDILASQKLVLTYSKILTSDTVLLPSARAIGLDYSYEKLTGMVSTKVEDETEIINIYVTSSSPDTAFDLAKSIAKESPRYMAQIVEGSSMKIVNNPKYPEDRFSPSYFRVGLIGAIIGALLASAFIIIKYFRDDSVKTENELEAKFGLPVFGIIPDIHFANEVGGNYYYQYSQRNGKKEEGGFEDGEGQQDTHSI